MPTHVSSPLPQRSDEQTAVSIRPPRAEVSFLTSKVRVIICGVSLEVLAGQLRGLPGLSSQGLWSRFPSGPSFDAGQRRPDLAYPQWGAGCLLYARVFGVSSKSLGVLSSRAAVTRSTIARNRSRRSGRHATRDARACCASRFHRSRYASNRRRTAASSRAFRAAISSLRFRITSFPASDSPDVLRTPCSCRRCRGILR